MICDKTILKVLYKPIFFRPEIKGVDDYSTTVFFNIPRSSTPIKKQ